jgi:hypothetical protein
MTWYPIEVNSGVIVRNWPSCASQCGHHPPRKQTRIVGRCAAAALKSKDAPSGVENVNVGIEEPTSKGRTSFAEGAG